MKIFLYLLAVVLVAFPAHTSRRHDAGSSGVADTTQRMWFINDASVDLAVYMVCQLTSSGVFTTATASRCAVGAGMRVQFIKMGAQVTKLTAMDGECRICLNVDGSTITSACITVGDNDMDDV